MHRSFGVQSTGLGIKRARRSSPTLESLGFGCPEGDAVGARAFADDLLRQAEPGRDRRDARLILTALCLQLASGLGPAPTLADLSDALDAFGPSPDDLEVFQDSPMPFLHYAYAEWRGLSLDTHRVVLAQMRMAAARARSRCNKNDAMQ